MMRCIFITGLLALITPSVAPAQLQQKVEPFAQGTAKAKADEPRVIYSSPLGPTRTGRLTIVCQAEELVGTAYDYSNVFIKTFAGKTVDIGDCRLEQSVAIDLPIKEVKELIIQYSGSGEDRHQTSWWLYNR